VMKGSGGEKTTAPRLESPAGSGFGFKSGKGRDYEAFEDTEEFFGEEEVELNPQAEDFTPGCSSKWFGPSWRKDEPGDEGGGGLRVGCLERTTIYRKTMSEDLMTRWSRWRMIHEIEKRYTKTWTGGAYLATTILAVMNKTSLILELACYND
jgi:hypothetical protein